MIEGRLQINVHKEIHINISYGRYHLLPLICLIIILLVHY